MTSVIGFLWYDQQKPRYSSGIRHHSRSFTLQIRQIAFDQVIGLCPLLLYRVDRVHLLLLISLHPAGQGHTADLCQGLYDLGYFPTIAPSSSVPLPLHQCLVNGAIIDSSVLAQLLVVGEGT
jgi:hypothetical protein